MYIDVYNRYRRIHFCMCVIRVFGVPAKRLGGLNGVFRAENSRGICQHYREAEFENSREPAARNGSKLSEKQRGNLVWQVCLKRLRDPDKLSPNPKPTKHPQPPGPKPFKLPNARGSPFKTLARLASA